MTDVPTTPTTPWYTGVEGFTPEIIGHLQSKGWDKLPAPQAALELTKSWKEAEKFVGVPANQLIRLPQDAKDEAGWKTVWSRLGAPADAKDYDFGTAKLDDATKEALRTAAGAVHLPKDSVTAIAAGLAKHLESAENAKQADYAAKVEGERTALAKDWGANHAANMITAKAAAGALGVTPEDVAALEKHIGYARVMKMFQNIGSKIGEDKFVTNDNGGARGIMTKEQATAKMSDLKKDDAWVKRYMSGGNAEDREMKALIAIITG